MTLHCASHLSYMKGEVLLHLGLKGPTELDLISLTQSPIALLFAQHAVVSSLALRTTFCTSFIWFPGTLNHDQIPYLVLPWYNVLHKLLVDFATYHISLFNTIDT